MASIYSVTVSPPYRDLQGRFAKADRAAKERARSAMRYLGGRLVTIGRNEAPSKTGAYRNSINYKTFERGDTIELRMYAGDPPHKWITGGTKAHLILPKRAKALRFFWANGPDGAKVYFFRWVWHPGTAANPWHYRAINYLRPEIDAELSSVAQTYAETIAGR